MNESKIYRYEANIINTFMLANNEDLLKGKRWYSDTKNRCNDISKCTGIGLVKVIGIFAVLSPACPIEKNFYDTEQLIKNRKHNTTTYKANKIKALEILALKNISIQGILRIIKGPKCKRFFLNILNENSKQVTIDRHAISIFFGEFDHNFVPTKRRLRIIRSTYMRVADNLGIQPRKLQAITWLVWKRINKI